jgi:hypothetical protein
MVCLGHLPVVPARSSFPTQTHAARGNLQACPIFDDGTRFYEGLAAVKLKSRRGVINAGGDFVIEPTLRNMGAHSRPHALTMVPDSSDFISKVPLSRLSRSRIQN